MHSVLIQNLDYSDNKRQVKFVMHQELLTFPLSINIRLVLFRPVFGVKYSGPL